MGVNREVAKKDELSFGKLHREYYTPFLKEVIERQVSLDMIGAHLIFKDCIASLDARLGSYAQSAKTDRESAGSENQGFYAPAVKLAELLHRAGWNKWMRENIPPGPARYILPTKTERLKQYGHSHLAATPFKELVAEAEKALAGRGRGR